MQCFLCKSSTDDPLHLGEFLKKKNIAVHYYCLLLTSKLVQGSSDESKGILGFLPKDIIAEENRIKSFKCNYCKQKYANITCCATKCLKFFHSECALKNNCLSEFRDTYRSFCDKHVEPLKKKHNPEEPCAICFEEMGEPHRVNSVLSPCCKTAWFHKDCLIKYASTAGYFFKCPKCNNSDIFTAEIPKRGVFIPEKDASWEMEPNAFSDQLVRPNKCEAEICKCDEGREHSEEVGPWDLQICLGCGSKSVHADCLNLGEDDDIYYICEACHGKVPQSVIDRALNCSETDEKQEDNDESLIKPTNTRRARIIRDEDESSSSLTSNSRTRRMQSKRSRNTRRRRRIADNSSDSDSDSDNTNSIILDPKNVKFYDCRVLIKRINSFDTSSLSNFSSEHMPVFDLKDLEPETENRAEKLKQDLLKDWIDENSGSKLTENNAAPEELVIIADPTSYSFADLIPEAKSESEPVSMDVVPDNMTCNESKNVVKDPEKKPPLELSFNSSLEENIAPNSTTGLKRKRDSAGSGGLTPNKRIRLNTNRNKFKTAALLQGQKKITSFFNLVSPS